MDGETSEDYEQEMSLRLTDVKLTSTSDFLESVQDFKSKEPPRLGRNMGTWKFESVGGFYLATEDVGKLSLKKQEELLIRDLIYAFSGVPSSHIRPDISLEDIPQLTTEHIDKVTFKIDDRFSGTLRVLAKDLLPLISYYISVQSFIEDSSMTTSCSRFLGNALQNDLQLYFEFQATLETQLQEHKLKMRQLVQQLRPWIQTMKAYANLTSRVRRLEPNSAQLLSLVDEQHQKCKLERVKILVQDISSYYMTMVQLWTQKGVIYDVRKEFFIEDTRANAMSSTLLSPKQCCHTYWEQRYRLHGEKLPSFLNPLAEEILLAGKYLNVLRQCNVQMKLMQEKLIYVPKDDKDKEEPAHVQLIRSAYELPARKLMEVLVQEQLLEHLQNLQNYFLLQDQDFLDLLLEKCAPLLLQTVDNVPPEKLKRITLESLQLSEDPHKHLLRSQLATCDVFTQLGNRIKRLQEKEESEKVAETTSETEPEPEPTPTETERSTEQAEQLSLYGYEAFSLSYEPNWPISLVIHEDSLEQLQLLHRVLFHLRYVQHQFHSSSYAPVKPNLHACELRQRMIKTIEQLEQHMLLDTVLPRWEKLRLVAQHAQLVDEVLNLFQTTVDQCLLLSLLSEPVTFVRSLFTLGQQCLNYCSYMEQEQPASADLDSDVNEYEEQFDGQLKEIQDFLADLAKLRSSSCLEESES